MHHAAGDGWIAWPSYYQAPPHSMMHHAAGALFAWARGILYPYQPRRRLASTCLLFLWFIIQIQYAVHLR